MASVIAVLGSDVSTDVIYPGRFMATVLPRETPPHAFADDPVLGPLARERRIAPGSVIVAGANFGCGSSREQAASCLKGHGIVVVDRRPAITKRLLELGIAPPRRTLFHHWTSRQHHSRTSPFTRVNGRPPRNDAYARSRQTGSSSCPSCTQSP
jgi:hypothetical protein